MASWREVNDMAKDPVLAHRTATSLLAVYRAELTEWELDFLEGLAARGPNGGELTTRQSEKLLEIRDDLKHYKHVDGLSVKRMIADCWPGRLDLDEGQEEFLERVKGRDALRRGDVSMLLRCARQLNLIEGYVDLERGSSFF